MNREYTGYSDEHWVARHPAATLTMVTMLFTMASVCGNMWIDHQQGPRWEKTHDKLVKLAKRDERLAAYQIESARYNRRMLEAIAKSAGARLPDVSLTDLERAETWVRDIRDGQEGE